MSFKFLLFILILLSPITNAEITINEIMYAPNSNWGGENNEWIELFNNGIEDASIANWTIHEKTIPYAIVPAQGYLILAKNTTKFIEVYGRSSVRVPFTLSNSGKALYLKTAGGSTIDSFEYTEYATSEMAKNNNRTLERNTTIWLESAGVGGTPGEQNSISFNAPPVQTPMNETKNTTNTTPSTNTQENDSDIPNTQQNQESENPMSLEILVAPDTMNFGGYSTIRAKFNSGNRDFETVRFVAYIYKPSWILRDLNGNGTTLRNSPYNSNAAAEVREISADETYYLVLPIFLKCNTEGYADATYTARLRAYTYENDEWKALTESDINIFVSGESESCKKEIGKETSCINKTIEKNCTEKTKILREYALEINITHPEIIFAGENFTTTVFLKNNGEKLRDIEIYSYMYEHSTIISSGFDGTKWGNTRTANSRKVTLSANDSITIELLNRAKENASTEKYTYKVVFADLADDKKSEERISLIELDARNASETNGLKNETLSNMT
ncbi:MAG: lamin tail domain-containing protein, partial [Nanoarchaeota archaeon]|nr:lamin tail domain-containing protein [Nanoarchaeota archaeon]